MKRILIYTIITLLLLSTVSAFNQTQLETYSNQNIKNYLINNLAHKGINHQFENVYKFYYKTRTIKKNFLQNYIIYDKFMTLELSKEDWITCRDSYSTEICKTNLIYNFGTYGEEDKKTVYQQLKEKLTKEYTKIIYYRDNSSEITEEITEELTI